MPVGTFVWYNAHGNVPLQGEKNTTTTHIIIFGEM